MRNTIVWSLSLLLGFQPAMAVEGSARKSADIRAFLEKSELSRKTVTLRELYQKNLDLLSVSERDSLRKFIEKEGDRKLPKMDISKVKGRGGKESIQLQAVQNGQSATLEIINESDVFARLNGKTLSMSDMRNVATLMEKAGVPASEVKAYFPTPAPRGKLLSARQIQKLPAAEQVRYFKNLRQLMESMEAVGKAFQPNLTSFQSTTEKWDIVLRWLRGEEAFASLKEAVGMSCVAAGWVAQTALDKTGRLKCGTDGGSGVAAQYRGNCPANEFQCNPTLYGRSDMCIPGGRDTTRICNEMVRGSDIPDLSKSASEFEALKKSAEQQAQEVASVCEGINSVGFKAEAAKPKKAKSKSAKASSTNPLTNLDDDQKFTCENFKKRYDEILSWGCDKPDFKAKYKLICPDKPEEAAPANPPPATEPPAPGTPAPSAPETSGPLTCDQLPWHQAVSGTSCEGGTVSNVITGVASCLDNGVKKDITECKCTSGTMVARFKCDKGSAGGVDSGSDSEGKKKKKKSGTNWWLIGAMGFGGLLLFNWLNKSALKEQYKQIEPVQQNPPLPPPAPMPMPVVPTPRGVN